MSAIVHINANGMVQLPPEILACIQPGAPYEVHTENARVVMEPDAHRSAFTLHPGALHVLRQRKILPRRESHGQQLQPLDAVHPEMPDALPQPAPRHEIP